MFLFYWIWFLFKPYIINFVAFVREHIWYKALLMGYSMRLELTRVCSLNGFQLVMFFFFVSSKTRYPAKTITDANYADDIAILATTSNQAETLLHSLEQAAAGIGLHVNAHKTEYMCFNQTGDISTLDGTSLKLVNKFTYLGSSVSSNEKKHRHAANEGMDSYR